MRRAAAALALLAAMAGPAPARTLVSCSEGDPESLDPGRVTTTTAMNATWPMFNNLVEFEPGATNIRPALARSWSVSPDGRSYGFTLRGDLRFQANDRFAPSRPMNADDVVFSFERQFKPDHPLHGDGFAYDRDLGLAELIESIAKRDAHHVRFLLKQADATVLANLAQSFGGILSTEYAGLLLASGMPEALAAAPFDLVEAIRRLGEAGYAVGFETDLWYLPVSRPCSPNGRRVADMIQADLERVGIRLRLVTEG